MAIVQRGIDQQHEQDPRQLLRDTRTLWQRFLDFFKDPTHTAVALVMCIVACWQIPGLSDVIALSGIIMFIYCMTRHTTLPFRMPMSSKAMDYNDPLPGSIKPQRARGIYFFGNDKKNNEELWFNNDDMRTHVLIFGSTGSGKTEALVSLAYNALIQSSGFIYVDGKGDNSLFAKVFSMCRRMGREDDLLLINFMTGARDIVGPQEKRLSNTMNPFANGSSSMLSQLVVSLMDAGSATPDGDMWKGRAIVFVEALMKILVYMRDQGKLLLDANTVRKYFNLELLESIVMDKQFPREGADSVPLSDAPAVVLEPIANYIYNLPGYDKTRKGKQVSQVLEQHGFITMQLTRVFGSLADTYGHIIRTNLPEVDMRDVVLNRRILVVLLPALEKSPDELANLGKIIVSSLKAMMAAGLGDEIEGNYRDVIQRKPTNSPTPYLCILDEYGYYAVKGFAVVPAQARSLGFSAVFAGQDLPAFQKSSKEEAASIGANTNIKICMKLEDPEITWEFFQKTAGEAFVTKVDAFQTRPESVTNTYLDTRSSSVEKRARIDLLDLKDQREGEAHVFFKSKIVRAKLFYAAPPPVEEMRLNHFIKVETPPARKLSEMLQRLEKFAQLINDGHAFANVKTESLEITRMQELFAKDTTEEPIERAINVLLNFQTEEAVEVVAEEEEESLEELDIFCKLRQPERDIITRDLAKFSQPLLNKNQLREQIIYLERARGYSEREAVNVAEEVINDMKLATHYPPIVSNLPTGEDLAESVIALNSSIKISRQSATRNME